MLSFIIPAYNEERELPATLESIHASAKAVGEPYEIIVADDDSDDATAEIARERGAIVTSVMHRQISATRNAGAAVARGDIFFFIDADTRVTGKSLRESLDALEDGAAGGGALIYFDGDPPLYARILLPVLDRAFRLFRFTGGCFMFCPRNVYENTGGFDESLYASEEMGFALGIKKQGPFVVINERVETSGRKLRIYSGWKILRAALKLMIPGSVKRRADVWYDGQREPTD